MKSIAKIKRAGILLILCTYALFLLIILHFANHVEAETPGDSSLNEACVEISFQILSGPNAGQDVASLSEIELPVDETGSAEEVEVGVRIQVVDPFFPETDNGKYTFAVRRDDAGWLRAKGNNAILRRAAPGEEVFSTSYDRDQLNFLSFSLDRPGQWVYTLELDSNDRGVAGQGNGCPAGEGDEEQVVGPFDVTLADPDPEGYLLGLCEELSPELSNNRFTCFKSDGGSNDFVGEPNDEGFCLPGYEIDVQRCVDGVTRSGESLPTDPGARVCLPCKPVDEQQEQLPGHTQICDPNPDDVNSCREGQGLQCRRIFEGGEFLCLYRSNSLDDVGDSCVRGAGECGFSTDVGALGGSNLICSPGLELGEIGQCERREFADLGEDECDPGNLGADCVRKFGMREGATCESIVGVYKCIAAPVEEEDPNISDSSPLNYAFSTEQFGAINCPHAAYFLLGESSSGYISRALAVELRDQGRSPLVVYNPFGGVPMSEVVDKNLIQLALEYGGNFSQERIAEFNQCVQCINDGAVWTGLGCINTTPEGIFSSILRIVLGVTGGVGLMLLAATGWQVAGKDMFGIGGSDRSALKEEAKKNATAFFAGLFLIVFSVVIVRFIAVNLLGIVPPGFF